ncbi:unnamed protein product [[Candida] boidinii]|uniref:Unnamed protein product n=1 Tax=Candida boidinii TaxID=5477 RepID=A0ACB5TMN3_CANBO|nr:unnamed protein product [[Candida] boidinii]
MPPLLSSSGFADSTLHNIYSTLGIPTNDIPTNGSPGQSISTENIANNPLPLSSASPETASVKKGKKAKGSKPSNSLVLNDGTYYKIQKVRQRKILSCIPCHQRKIKCSREKPVG